MPTINGEAPGCRAPLQGYYVTSMSALQGYTDSSRDLGWTWPPYVPEEPIDRARFRIEGWAPASTVRHPWVRVGRFTLLYRRAA